MRNCQKISAIGLNWIILELRIIQPMKPNPRNVLLIGYDEHLCLSVLFCLRKARDYNFYVLTTKEKSSAGYSWHVKGLEYVSSYEAIEQGAMKCIQQWDIDLLMPFGEKEGLAIAKAKDRLSKVCRIMPSLEQARMRLIPPQAIITKQAMDCLGRFISQKVLLIQKNSHLLMRPIWTFPHGQLLAESAIPTGSPIYHLIGIQLRFTNVPNTPSIPSLPQFYWGLLF